VLTCVFKSVNKSMNVEEGGSQRAAEGATLLDGSGGNQRAGGFGLIFIDSF
jgi:hypothetical protein